MVLLDCAELPAAHGGTTAVPKPSCRAPHLQAMVTLATVAQTAAVCHGGWRCWCAECRRRLCLRTLALTATCLQPCCALALMDDARTGARGTSTRCQGRMSRQKSNSIRSCIMKMGMHGDTYADNHVGILSRRSAGKQENCTRAARIFALLVQQLRADVSPSKLFYQHAVVV